MANELLNQLFGLLQGLRTDASNLHRDLDDRDEREETGGDLTSIFSRFDELKDIMSQLDASDVAQLRDELRKLMSGQEDILEYNRDVTNILSQVKKRTQEHAPTKAKIMDNLPDEHKDTPLASLFDNWQSVLGNVSKWLEAGSSTRIGR